MIYSSGSITTQNLNPGSGTATAGSTVGITNSVTSRTTDTYSPYATLANQRNIVVQVTGTWTGTLSVQVNLDGANWVAFGAVTSIATNTAAATITGNGIYTCPQLNGMQQARVTATGAMTGTAVVTVIATAFY